MKEKLIRHLWRKTNCSHVQTVHIFFIYVLIIILLLLPIMHLMYIYIYISILFSCSVSSKILAC